MSVATPRLRVALRLGGGTPLQRFLAGSAVVHLLLGIVVILLPSLLGRHAPFEDAVFVDLVAAAPSASRRATPPAATAPPPPVEEAQPTEDVRVETKPTEPAPEKVEPAKKPKPKPPEPKPQPPRPAAATPPADRAREPEADGIGPDSGAAATGDAGGEVAAAELGTDAYSWYRTSVTAALYSHWQRPVLSGARESFEVRVTFDILTNGTVVNARIDTSSGIASLDRSALRAVGDASPLPPLPRSLNEPRLSAAFVFRLHPDN